ncbi:MAG TPA: hypothetical protein PKH07_09835 [bacterium]|nr:hypothetical protein [bacterium]
MKKYFFLSLMLVLATGAYAGNPVTVDSTNATPDGVNTFSTITSAISSWCAGGTNAGQTAPFVINVVNGPYSENIRIDKGLVGLGDIVGELIIQAATPVNIRLNPSSTVGGMLLYQDTYDVTFNNFIFSPDAGSSYVMNTLIMINDPASPAMNRNWVKFYNCVFTEAYDTGAPMVTDKASALANKDALPGTRSGKMSASAGKCLMKGATNNGLQSVRLDNCVLYGPPQIGFELNVRAGDDIIVHDTLAVYCAYSAYRCLGNAVANQSFTGTDAGAGPTQCTAIINSPWSVASTAANGKALRFEASAAVTSTVSNVLISNSFLSGNAYVGGININGNQGSVNMDNVIIDTHGDSILMQPANACTLSNATLNSSARAGIAFTAAAAGSLTVTNTIFSGAGTKITGTVPTAGLSVNYSAFVESGPDAITARYAGQVITYGVNIINNDPEFKSKDVTNEDFFDLASGYYPTKGIGGTDVAGGADCDATAIADWMLY